MSVDTITHVGAYLELEVKKIKKETPSGKECPSCKNIFTFYDESVYCNKCGTKLNVTVWETLEYPSYYYLIKDYPEYEDVLICMNDEEKDSEFIYLASNSINDKEAPVEAPYALEIKPFQIIPDVLLQCIQIEAPYALEIKPFQITPEVIQQCIQNFMSRHIDIIVFLKKHEEVVRSEVKFGAYIYYI